MKTIINLPPHCQPCRPLCLFCPLAVTARIQANPRGMLIMPAHDISKISPTILGCPFSHPLHLDLLAHPAERGVLFSVWAGRVGWCLFTLLRPPFFFSLGGDFCAYRTSRQQGLCDSLSAAGDGRRNTQAFVPMVTQRQSTPRVQRLILDIVCIIFNLVVWGTSKLAEVKNLLFLIWFHSS